MSRIAIMQPYFLPYLGYFGLIANTDRFVLLDEVQYIRHGWINRNRLSKANGGWFYIQVPLQPHSHTTSISEVRIDNAQPWREKILAQLVEYKRRAPHYWPVRKLLTDLFANSFDDIVSLNRAALATVCERLVIPTGLEVFSTMDLAIEPPSEPDDWALNIARALGEADEYWNPPGGESFFDSAKYKAAGIALRFHEQELAPYDQGTGTFEPGLSIIDVMMFNEPEQVRGMLDSYRLNPATERS